MDYWPGPRSKTPARFGHHFSFAFAFPWIILYFLFFLSSPLQKEQLLYTITTLQSELLVSFIFISLSPSLSPFISPPTPFISPPTPSMLHVFLLFVIVLIKDDGCNGALFSNHIALFFIPVVPFLFLLRSFPSCFIYLVELCRVVICVQRTKRGRKGQRDI